MVTLIEILVYFPVLEECVFITAPKLLNVFSTKLMLVALVGTINLYKYTAGQVVDSSNSDLSLM